MEVAAAEVTEAAAAAVRRDWANLLPEIMDLIVKKIDRYTYFIIFASVCRNFKLATRYINHPETPSNFPLLMLSDGTDYPDGPTAGEKTIETRSLYNIFTTKLFDINLPQAFGKKCLAVNFGWLLTLSLDQEIKLLHPFSKRQIDLPDCRTLAPHSLMPVLDERFYKHLSFFISRAVISSSPDDSNNNCIVFVVFANWRRLAFTRIGEDHWTIIETPLRGFKDIIYHQGLLFAVNGLGIVYNCNVDDEHPKLIVVAPTLPDRYLTYPNYLVEMDGNLLVVTRLNSGIVYDSDSDSDCDNENELLEDETQKYYTSNFFVYQLKNHGFEGYKYPYQLVKLRSLGKRALFLGNNSSTCIPCSKNNLIKANCIYVTDDNWEKFVTTGGGYDMGIFDFQNKTMQRHYSGPSRSNHCPPLWLI